MNEHVLAQIEAAATKLDEAADYLHGAASDMDMDESDAEVIHAVLVHAASDLALSAALLRMKVRQERAARTTGEGTGAGDDGEGAVG